MKTLRSICFAFFIATCIYLLCALFVHEFDFRLWSIDTQLACAIPMAIFGYVAYALAEMLQTN
jgi:hypothetical protein